MTSYPLVECDSFAPSVWIIASRSLISLSRLEISSCFARNSSICSSKTSAAKNKIVRWKFELFCERLECFLHCLWTRDTICGHQQVECPVEYIFKNSPTERSLFPIGFESLKPCNWFVNEFLILQFQLYLPFSLPCL